MPSKAEWRQHVDFRPSVVVEELGELVQELLAVFNSSHDGIYVVDGNGYTVRVNPAYEAITGIKAEEVLGRHVGELVECGYFIPSVALEVLRSKRPVTLVQTNRNGKIVLTTGTPAFDESGDIFRVISNVRDITELIQLYEALSGTRNSLQNNAAYNLKELGSDELVAESPAMRRVVHTATRLAQFDSTVLLLGEPGVGKGVIAKLIHRLSRRRDAPFVTVNCAAIPEQLLESELFGYTPGAFTGARRGGKMGLFESANSGTVFLDEIGELPLSLQPKLLQVLESHEVTRIGANRPTPVDVRIIAATNRDLEEMVKAGAFRRDLYYRLCVIPLFIPPLRERREDIVPLVLKFVDQNNKRYGTNKTVTPEVLDFCLAYQWPGNVRELMNLIERLFVLSPSSEIKLEDLPPEYADKVRQSLTDLVNVELAFPLSLPEVVRQLEKTIVSRAVNQAGSIRKAARLLGIDPSTVCRKLHD